jgi:hypothetical protein
MAGMLNRKLLFAAVIPFTATVINQAQQSGGGRRNACGSRSRNSGLGNEPWVGRRGSPREAGDPLHQDRTPGAHRDRAQDLALYPYLSDQTAEDLELLPKIYAAQRRGETNVQKYSPDEPRAPAGSPEGGQWTNGGGGADRGQSPGRLPGDVARGGNRQTAGSGDVSFGHAEADAFHAAIHAAKQNNPWGAAVNLYTPKDYRDMRLYLSADHNAGFALKGDDIVSLFKNPASKATGIAKAALALAVKDRGRRLDAFDTELPKLYSTSGFRAVARLAWTPAT